jgi:hypothetical protein
MKQKLIKISNTHYVIVDDSQIKAGDYISNIFLLDKGVYKVSEEMLENELLEHDRKVTYSTQPLGCNCAVNNRKTDSNCAERNHCFHFDAVKSLSLSEVEELINGYSVEKMAEREYREYPNNPIDKPEWKFNKDINCHRKRKAYIKGFNAHKNLVKDKLFTAQDVINIVEKSRETGLTAEYFITKHLLPETEWNVEFDENNKLKLI